MTDPESELAALMRVRLGSVLRSFLARYEEAEEHLKIARDLAARHGYKEVELELVAEAIEYALIDLKIDRLPELERQLADLEAELGRTSLRLAAFRQAGWLYLLGDIAGGRRQAERLMEAARRARDPFSQTLLLRPLASAHYLLGEYEEMERFLRLDERTHSREPDEYMEMARCVLAEAVGDLDGARAGAEAAITTSTRLRLPDNVSRWTATLSGIERRAGDRERAESVYKEAVAQMLALPSLARSRSLFVAAHLAPEAAARGDAEVMARCREMLAQYEGLLCCPYNSPTPIMAARVLGMIDAAERHWDEAVRRLQWSVSFCSDKGLPVELAHCRLALADALMHRNPATGSPLPLGEGQGEGVPSSEDRRQAMALYDQALADYQRLGMPLYVQDVLARKELLKA